MQVRVIDRYNQEILVGSNVLVTAMTRHSGMEQREIEDIRVEHTTHRFYENNPAHDPSKPANYKTNPMWIYHTGPAVKVTVKTGKILRSGLAPDKGPATEVKIHGAVVVDKLI